jgi:hypothetical protein
LEFVFSVANAQGCESIKIVYVQLKIKILSFTISSLFQTVNFAKISGSHHPGEG